MRVEQLRDRIYSLYKEARQSHESLVDVAGRLGGLTIQERYTPVTLLRAIAEKVLGNDWDFEILDLMGEDPQVLITGYRGPARD